MEERFGWRPVSVGVFLVLAGSSTNRGRVARVASLLQAVLPARNIQIRRWLAMPRGNLGGIWFVRWPGRVAAGRATRAHTAFACARPPRAGDLAAAETGDLAAAEDG